MKSSLQSQAGKVLDRLFRDFEGPNFSVRLWDGWQWKRAPHRDCAFNLSIETPGALRALFLRPNEISLGEAFIQRELDIEGDIFSAFGMAEHLFDRPKSAWRHIVESILESSIALRRMLALGASHSRKRDRTSISYHYDQPVDFYRLWLGETLAYSCAYFRSPHDSLEVAQSNKLDLICKKLRLRPLDNFLDIGCGWGSLLLHAAKTYQTQAHGITLSESQKTVAAERIREHRFDSQCLVELRDYRDCQHLRGSFDKIASVGMFEHVGLSNLASYFSTAYSLLKPGGVFLNHGIARSCSSPARSLSFIDRYVFPDGRLVTLSEAIERAEAAGFEVRDVENLREHYELTLRHWVKALEKHVSQALQHVSDTTLRVWRLYMAGSAAAFHRGDIAVYQILLSRPNGGKSGLPLVREDWYAHEARHEAAQVRLRTTLETPCNQL